jgi:hypothetical protein
MFYGLHDMALRFCELTQSVVALGNAIWAYESGHLFSKMNKNILPTNVTWCYVSLKQALRDNVPISYSR